MAPSALLDWTLPTGSQEENGCGSRALSWPLGTLVQSALESKYLTLFAVCEAVRQHVAQPLNIRLERIRK